MFVFCNHVWLAKQDFEPATPLHFCATLEALLCKVFFSYFCFFACLIFHDSPFLRLECKAFLGLFCVWNLQVSFCLCGVSLGYLSSFQSEDIHISLTSKWIVVEVVVWFLFWTHTELGLFSVLPKKAPAPLWPGLQDVPP